MKITFNDEEPDICVSNNKLLATFKFRMIFDTFWPKEDIDIFYTEFNKYCSPDLKEFPAPLDIHYSKINFSNDTVTFQDIPIEDTERYIEITNVMINYAIKNAELSIQQKNKEKEIKQEEYFKTLSKERDIKNIVHNKLKNLSKE